ncbi:hypothetical protein ABT160_42645 [Streptomyces sp. NPDC001941]|uniref:hypothetical protein n=1 Tax=Streptomyces sp. NPDC001941 TaxID=3154659 RepID=UPI00332EAA53
MSDVRTHRWCQTAGFAAVAVPLLAIGSLLADGWNLVPPAADATDPAIVAYYTDHRTGLLVRSLGFALAAPLVLICGTAMAVHLCATGRASSVRALVAGAGLALTALLWAVYAALNATVTLTIDAGAPTAQPFRLALLLYAMLGPVIAAAVWATLPTGFSRPTNPLNALATLTAACHLTLPVFALLPAITPPVQHIPLMLSVGLFCLWLPASGLAMARSADSPTLSPPPRH